MEGKGYEVLHAADGSEALEKIALMLPPSLVLLDIQLPDVDGITILETIRATPDWQDVPVIMLTAVSDEQRIRKVLSLNVQGYVLKPFKRETLMSHCRAMPNAAGTTVMTQRFAMRERVTVTTTRDRPCLASSVL